MYHALRAKLPDLAFDCPGRLFNNMPSHKIEEAGGNAAFIRRYWFNLCPENMQCPLPGYITEKLLHCCLGGSIPIYHGWFDEEDAKVFNRDRILFYEPTEASVDAVSNRVQHLMKHPDELLAFAQQPVFYPNAKEVMENMEAQAVAMLHQTVFSRFG
jgi:hypothetical protein